MTTQEDPRGPARTDASRKLTKVIAVALVGIVMLIGAVWVAASLMLKSAIKDLNASGKKVTAEHVRAKSLEENANALAAINQGDLLLLLPTTHIKESVIAVLTLANASLRTPLKTSDTDLTTSDQVVTFSTRIDGKDPKSGIEIKGRLHGVVGTGFVNNDCIVRPAAERIELEEVKIPGWNWFPGQIVRVLNPVIARFIEEINGAIQPAPMAALPPPSPAQKVKLGSKDVDLPAVTVLPPSIMVGATGIQALVQLTGTPAKTHPAKDLASFQQAFMEKTRAGFPDAGQLTAGLNVSDALLRRMLGSLAEPGELATISSATVTSNVKVLTEMAGPDIALRLSAAESNRLITASIAKSVSEIKGADYVLSDVKHSFENGIIGVDAKVVSNIKFGKGGNIQGTWSMALGVVPSIDSAEKMLYLTPKVAAVQLQSVSVSGGAPEFSVLVPAVNVWLDAFRVSLNKVLPKVPVALPVVAPQEVELKPIDIMGGKVSFVPSKILPPAVTVSRALISVTPNGLWILADIDAPGLAARPPLPNPFEAGVTTPGFNDLDAAVTKTVLLKYGEIPSGPLFGFASWNRFAAIFNASWDSVAPRIDGSFDTGTVQMATQKINLMDYARFSCGRTVNCTQDRCEQRSCSQDSCSQRGCGSCGDLDLGCKARKLICDAAAVLEKGSCDAAAAVRKGACDTQAVADKGACDVAGNAKLLACNAGAEAQVAACEVKKGLTNGVAEISGVGAIGGDARARGAISIDVRRVVLNEQRPGVTFAPVIDGKITGNIGLDWTPYDFGHLFVCPVRGKVFVESSASFNRSQPTVVATIEPTPVVAPAPNEAAPTGQYLTIKVSPFRFPVAMQPGLLNSLYTQNPQIVATCPVASGFLGVPGLIIGNSFKAISEGNIMTSLAVAAVAPGVVGPMLLANERDDVRAGMGTLFGGSFFIPVGASEHKIAIKDLVMPLPGGSVNLKPTLAGNVFKLVVTEAVKGGVKVAKQ